MPPKRILILGGTADARALAEMLLAHGCDVTTALAGVTQSPQLPPGKIRIGGFGGSAGLAAYLASEAIEAIADATHPFAVQISHHAAAAAAHCGLGYFRLERPAWSPQPGDAWIDAQTAERAAALLPTGARVLLTIGRKEIAPFLARLDLAGSIRMIEAPASPISAAWQILRARPPFSFADECRLIIDQSITHLITKNSGGDILQSKLQAARHCAIKVVMIARPAKPQAIIAATPQALTALLLA
jgi:precorrin-6A/cobalt-precorrin-6A reductase